LAKHTPFFKTLFAAMAIQWRISGLRTDESIIIEGYHPDLHGRPCLLDTKITKTTLEKFTASESRCDEGQTLVVINPENCYWIEIHFMNIEDRKWIQYLQKK
jgi:hypothetical protein